MNTRTAMRAFATASGLAMIAACLPHAPSATLACAVAAAVLVVAGLWIRQCAVPAVMVTGAALLAGYPTPALAAVSGLAGCIYLLATYGIGFPAPVFTLTRPTLIGAGAFALIGATAASIPAEVRWLPVLAPIAVVLLGAVVLVPYAGSVRSGDRHHDI